MEVGAETHRQALGQGLGVQLKKGKDYRSKWGQDDGGKNHRDS